ncbi:MAG: HypC/HybG/HupF family hydrogenase formation chaperone [Candidatus Berkiellales bacterium]
MCLAIPGKIIAIEESNTLLKQGQVDFSGIRKTISLSFTPEAQIGDYVIVHVGFAISILDEAAALQMLNTLDQYFNEHDEISN